MANLESHLLINRCPHCGIDTPSITSVHRFQSTDYDGKDYRYWAVYTCARCGGAIIASSYQQKGFIQEMYPNQVLIDNSIPQRAKHFLEEAIASLHAPSGAIMLAASSIDAMLKEKGYKEGKLYSRINNAVKDHLITQEMAEWAHEVRIGANDERHADETAELPKLADAKKAVEFVKAFAEYLFVLPSKVARGRNPTNNLN